MRRLGHDHRLARVGSGISLRAVGAATSTSHQQVLRFERGELDRASIADLGAWCAVVGLDLVIRAYPSGDPIRDVAQQRLIGRLRRRLQPELRWRTEVPLPVGGDLRAWDAVISGRTWSIAVEAETVLDDLQALERRLTLKQRDGGAERVILLIADTTRNRRAITAAPAAFAGFDRRARRLLAALARGDEPDGSALLLL